MRYIIQTPLQAQRDRVEKLAGFGATEEDIAAELQIPLKRLQKRFGRELSRGNALGKHNILEKVYAQAESGKNPTVASFWVKSRCGWRDTGIVANAKAPAESVFNFVTRQPPDAPAPAAPLEPQA
jgi:hypothetical protein